MRFFSYCPLEKCRYYYENYPLLLISCIHRCNLIVFNLFSCSDFSIVQYHITFLFSTMNNYIRLLFLYFLSMVTLKYSILMNKGLFLCVLFSQHLVAEAQYFFCYFSIFAVKYKGICPDCIVKFCQAIDI